MKLGSIEAGGTKFVLAVGDEDYNLVEQVSIPTTAPEETLAKSVDFFKEKGIDALGIGSFGPLSIKPSSKDYGYILATAKPHWQNVDMITPFKEALNMPVALTTDVNASALGEYSVGAGKDVNSLIYFTVGTGIGGGAIQDGQFIGGYSHAEMGHTLVTPRADDDFKGVCPYHKNMCFEGLASGPAIQQRTGQKGETLPRNHPVFDLVRYYIAELTYNALLNFAPERIVFGGSVLQAQDLKLIGDYVKEINNGYVDFPKLDQIIVPSQVPNNGSATVGDFVLAHQTLA